MQNNHGNQTIQCEVGSCRFNRHTKDCSLDTITVMPVSGQNASNADESMCGSYRIR